MSRRATSAVLATVVVLATFVAPGNWLRPTQAQTVGDRLDRAIETIGDEGRDLLSNLREGLEKAKAAVDAMSVEARVYARLRWDKALNNADISVDLEENGLVTLTGAVASEEAKAKATRLAEDTVGVQRVINRMAVIAGDSSSR